MLESEEVGERATGQAGRPQNLVYTLPHTTESIAEFLTPALARVDVSAGGTQVVVVTRDAETALTLGLTAGRDGFFLHRATARALLADLRIRQGRLQEAEQLLAACGDRWEAIPTRAKLHYVRREFEHAVSSVKQALRQIGEDHVRAVPLLTLLADAEIARNDPEAAARAANQADRLAR